MTSTSRNLKLSSFSLLSFDYYGTLINWQPGILKALKPLLEHFPDLSLDDIAILELYSKLERTEEEENSKLKYSEILSNVHSQLAQHFSNISGQTYEPTTKQNETFSTSIGNWQAFPDSYDALQRLRANGLKLVVVSNVDRKSFALTNNAALKGFKWDAVYTAEDIGSYKPDPRNFEYMLAHVKEELGVEKDKVLQTANSLRHDHKPAQEMGLRSAWIAREHSIMGTKGAEDAKYDFKFMTLGGMADALDLELKEKHT